MESQNQLPFSDKSRSRGTSFFRTFFNGFNVLSGIGILSMPYATSQGGWVTLALLLFAAILFFYTGLLLKRCMDSNSLIKTYPDIGEVAFGYKGRALVSIFMYLELYLVAVEFLILEGDNLEKLFPHMNFKVAGLRIGGKQGFVVLTALAILPTTWLRSLGVLAYVSAGGVLASFILVFCVSWVGVFGGVGFHERGHLLHWEGLPTSVSLFAFCFCGHAVYPTLRNSMKDRSQFSMVLLVCFVSSTLTYGSMAIIGYLMYGDHLKSQVTLNLSIKNISSNIAIYATIINPFAKYAVIITPIAAAIEETNLFNKTRLVGIFIRTSILISTVLVALFIPFFGYVMAFIGAFFSVTCSLILPCLCYLRIHKTAQRFGMELIIIIVVLLLASVIGVVGTYNSLRQIVEHL